MCIVLICALAPSALSLPLPHSIGMRESDGHVHLCGVHESLIKQIRWKADGSHTNTIVTHLKSGEKVPKPKH